MVTIHSHTPANISTKSEPAMERKGTLASEAVALASNVFPVPGGPYSRAPWGRGGKEGEEGREEKEGKEGRRERRERAERRKGGKGGKGGEEGRWSTIVVLVVAGVDNSVRQPEDVYLYI